MGNPRQRRKQKSGSYKPTRTTNSKSAKKTVIKNVPEEIARQWDKRLTMRENYARLGLASSLKIHATGGTEKELPTKIREKRIQNGENVDENEEDNTVTETRGKIVRDENGNIVDVIMASTSNDKGKGKGKEDETAWGKPLDANNLETPEVPLTFADKDNISNDTDAVKLLEAKAATSRPVGRNSSNDEMKWLLNIVQKYGRDIEEASRDLKINVWQKTKGEISRAIKRAGGFDYLESQLKQNH